MSVQEKLDQVLARIRQIMDDEVKLTQVLEFLETEILEKDASSIMEDEDFMARVPERYRKIVAEIADNMSANHISYFNPETLEIEFIPKDFLYEALYEGEDEDEDEYNDEVIRLKHRQWEKCIEIEPLESFESFKIMERFAERLENVDKKEASYLWRALSGKKPFANFNHQIHNSDYREDWFAFRQKELEKYVIDNYFYNLNESTDN